MWYTYMYDKYYSVIILKQYEIGSCLIVFYISLLHAYFISLSDWYEMILHAVALAYP